MGAVLVGLLVKLDPFAKFSGMHCKQEKQPLLILLLCNPLYALTVCLYDDCML